MDLPPLKNATTAFTELWRTHPVLKAKRNGASVETLDGLFVITNYLPDIKSA